jgi:hypothetical protein
MISPVVWVPALVCLGLFLTLWGGMSFAYDRGRRHEREERDADRAARAIRGLGHVPAHVPPRTELVQEPVMIEVARRRAWEEHERQAMEMANTRPDDPHPSGPMPRLYQCQWCRDPGCAGDHPDLTDSAFNRRMAAEVDRGMAEVERILSGEQP